MGLETFPAAVVPQPAAVGPKSEAGTASKGVSERFAREDHTHQRLSFARNVTLDVNGFATFDFMGREFDVEPAIAFAAIGAGTDPVPDFRAEFIKTGAMWTSVKVYGQRSKPLPTMTNTVSPLAILTGVISALNSVMGLLSGFTPYEPAAGARASVIVIQPST